MSADILMDRKRIEESTWDEFRSIAAKGDRCLLKRLDDFPNSILITGCQRSGTTMLARIITESDGMTQYGFGSDDELAGALILSGLVEHTPFGRYCFQTTYLNERYWEYYNHRNGHKIVWLLRNPLSVTYSMLHNWGGHTPNRLFLACGIPVLRGMDRLRYRVFGLRGLSNLRRACWAYHGKTLQLFELVERLGTSKIMVVDYDDLVTRSREILPHVYRFLGILFREEYVKTISVGSIRLRKRLSKWEVNCVESINRSIYLKARDLVSIN
jgi:hypothetical protein